MKGVSANLLKTGSKRRRTQQQIEDDKQEEIDNQLKIKAKLD